MTTLTSTHSTPPTPAASSPSSLSGRRPESAIPQSRLVGLEVRKMVDTRSGFWLMMSIVVTAVLATGAVIAFGPEEAMTYASFATAVGFPMTVILPMMAILSVTSEWSQRSGLGTFTLVPHRGRVIWAKAVATLIVGVVSMAIAFLVGVVGNLLGAAIAGIDPVWDIPVSTMATIVIADLLGMILGFTLGVLIRSSAAAIVAYFVVTLLVPTLTGLLAMSQQWFADVQDWLDFNTARNVLYDGLPTGEQWAQLATSGALWLLLPLVIGLLTLRRSEVK